MKLLKMLTAAMALVAGCAHATLAIPAVKQGDVTFTEVMVGPTDMPWLSSIQYSVWNNFSDTSIVAFAISTGAPIGSDSGHASTSYEGWSAEHISKSSWALADFNSYYGGTNNPFAAYAQANPVFDAVFDGDDSGLAMFWVEPGFEVGIAPGEFGGKFFVQNVWAASEILALTADGRVYRSSAFVAAVPEPSTYALMAACIGVIGWMNRRRV
jgi:PEP-CTERM motif